MTQRHVPLHMRLLVVCLHLLLSADASLVDRLRSGRNSLQRQPNPFQDVHTGDSLHHTETPEYVEATTTGMLWEEHFYDGCDRVYSGTSGIISVVLDETYHYPEACAWYVSTPPGTVIRLTFLDLYVWDGDSYWRENQDECSGEVIALYDGSGTLIDGGMFCGSQTQPPLPFTLVSRTNHVEIQLYGVTIVMFSYFTLQFEAQNVTEVV